MQRKPYSVLRSLKARPRLMLAALFGALLMVLLPGDWRHTTRVLVAWDSFTGLYLMLAMWMMVCSTHEQMRGRAVMQDESRFVALVLATGAALASLAAIVAELSTAKAIGGAGEWQHIALAGLTVFLSWTFMQTMFALHYAHEYYMECDGKLARGLEFPCHSTMPDYWDFVYQAFVIGTSTATADVNITGSIMRKITTLQCVVAFFFNTTILALTVNIGAGLF